MRWFEYKTEVDALHAPDELKARLLAMKPDAAAEHNTTRRSGKSALAFPGWKKLSGMAACFAAGAVTVAVGGGLLFGSLAMGGASAADNATGAFTEPGAMAQSSTLHSENSRDHYGAIADDMMDSIVQYTEEMETAMEAMNGAATPAQPKGDSDEAKAVTDSQRAGELETAKQPARKIIYTADLTLETTEYDATLAALAEALNVAGGYVEHSENMNYGTTSRRVHYVLRVPVEQYRSFLGAAEGTGSLTDKTEDSQDITAQYVDVTARIDTLLQQRTRLQQLSAQAETLYDLLEIEEKLSNVQYQLESYQRQLAIYDDQVDYCTVTVTVREVTVYTPVQPTVLERMQNALTRGFGDFADTLFDAVLWVLRNLSWLAVLTVAALVGRRVWRKRRAGRGE